MIHLTKSLVFFQDRFEHGDWDTTEFDQPGAARQAAGQHVRGTTANRLPPSRWSMSGKPGAAQGGDARNAGAGSQPEAEAIHCGAVVTCSPKPIRPQPVVECVAAAIPN